MGITVAALFVAKGGCYFGLPNVDPWDETRDARLYAGPHPVVAHPPCARWSMLAAVNEARYGLKRGEDGGCFAAALAQVRRWGGVLEHPAETLAWKRFGLPRPCQGAWVGTLDGGWVTEVAQRNYGHRAQKRTWLYAHGVAPPSMDWRPPPPPSASISTDRPSAEMTVEHMGRRERLATPNPFRDLLLSIARTAKNRV